MRQTLKFARAATRRNGTRTTAGRTDVHVDVRRTFPTDPEAKFTVRAGACC
ncbi:hypothetical protein [Streptomyces sp. DH12]|uniref:hypothetical protein n=1 Tax=Streptomyces sp. DH12 TaxID=2857010 RepID=UPI001E4FA30A|nr:hypothetical protein [Streptomyces sp. DH12]